MSGPVSLILSRLSNVKESKDGWVALCPAHEDRSPSLSISQADDGRALVHCHAGCSTDSVCCAVGLCVADLFPPDPSRDGSPSRPANGNGRIVAEYGYRDESGKLLFQSLRYEPKSFRQRKPKPDGGWDWSVKGVRVIPYRLPELIKDTTRTVFIVEGEKDCDNLARIGILATCNAGGAGKWTAEHSEFLRGRNVVVLPDNDDPGQNHARKVALSLHGIAESVRIVELPGLPIQGDVSDWIGAHGDAAEPDELRRQVEALASNAPVWTPEAEPWPEVIPFNRIDLPEFPTLVLPDPLYDFVKAVAHATQTPADLAGLLSLAVCSACIAKRVRIECSPGWTEPTNLFVAVLLDPANRKSAVFREVSDPLNDLENELIEASRPEIARQRSRRRQLESQLKKLEKAAAEQGDQQAAHEAEQLAAELSQTPDPVDPCLIVGNSTAERLEMILCEQNGRVACLSAEGDAFDIMAGRYSKNGAPNFDVFLKGHAGDDLTVDRISRGRVKVSQPALTCGFACQPDVIREIAENPPFRRRGLLARFLYAIPRSLIGVRETDPVPVPDTVREAYRRTVRRLSEIQGEAVLTLDSNAASMFSDWRREIETLLADGGDLEMIRDWGGKLAGATLRIAAVLHCVEHGPTGWINDLTMAAAIDLGRYLIPHAEVVLTGTKGRSVDQDAEYIWKWFVRGEHRQFTKRDAQQGGRRRFPSADDIDPALTELTRRGFIRPLPIESTGPGRPPSPRFEVNPLTFETTENCTHNPQNPRQQS